MIRIACGQEGVVNPGFERLFRLEGTEVDTTAIQQCSSVRTLGQCTSKGGSIVEETRHVCGAKDLHTFGGVSWRPFRVSMFRFIWFYRFTPQINRRFLSKRVKKARPDTALNQFLNIVFECNRVLQYDALQHSHTRTNRYQRAARL